MNQKGKAVRTTRRVFDLIAAEQQQLNGIDVDRTLLLEKVARTIDSNKDHVQRVIRKEIRRLADLPECRTSDGSGVDLVKLVKMVPMMDVAWVEKIIRAAQKGRKSNSRLSKKAKN